MSDNIKVVVKVRPLIPREIEEKLSYQWRVKNNTLYQLDQNGKDYGQCFTFDKVYDKDSKTTDVYHDIAKPIVEAATAGFNGTIFAYGQTSSGKTYTMTGTENSPGIIPLAVLHLFETIKNIPDRDFLVRVSYIEIYNETLKDLLSVEKKIKIHDTLQGVKVDATEKVASSPEEVLGIMKEGEANRQVGATNMNEESSRSHSIFQITIESREHIEGEEESGSVNVSQLNLVDLAGSERAGQTGATGIRFKEGTHINKSLSVLALVIKQLSEDRNKYANYRDSKLTRILQNSLGGNAKTSIICAVTPAAIDETISTLQFANRAKAIKNKPEVNAVATNATMIQSLTKQLSRLQSQLESKKNLEQDNYKLTKQIVSLQRLILNGFGQRNPKDLSTNRRKTWCAPRRMTISTLHPIEEDPVPVAPKFCTPVLKYNPMVTSAEFIPIQNTSKLTTVSEESTSGLITPTPLDKKVNFNDEIIELDSDDDEDDEDESTDVQTCSPYHKCYGSSKTPPCVLRRNAKQAEKSLQDLVELTDREKIYSPTVVELIEKLEQNTIVITKLEDEIESLNDKCKDKDSEINTLKDRINKTEEEVKTVSSNKLELEAQCKEFKSRLTDWEVSYETLQKRAKSREEELLSLLNEKTVDKVSVDIGKPSAITLDKELANFMNMSKDMSLVNSDNESSITNDEESSTQVQDLVTVMQKQLTDKNQIMIDLEAKLNIQKHRIEHLEHSSKELQEKIVYFNNKLSNVHHENAQLKSTIDALNLTIKNQREHLETVNNDIESYNALIHELQIKVNERNNKLNVDDIKIDDYTLETMIANEEKFIANNENLKNIIQSMKIAIESRNTEITNLKHKLQSNTDSAQYNISLQEELENKEKQIISLMEETEVLKKQLNENVEIINELIEEKNKFKNVESQLINKLETENANYILKMQNKEHVYQIDDSNKKQQEIANKSLEKQIEEMAHEIVNLKNEIDDRDSVIDSLKESDNNKLLELSKLNNDKDSVIDSLKESENNKLLELSKAKILIPKLQDIILLLTGDVQEIPEEIDSTNLAINTITDSLEIMNNAANEVILERDRALENNIKLNNDILNMVAQHQSDIDKLKLEMDNENKLLIEIKRHNKQLTTDLETVRYDLEITNKMNIELETELNSTKERNENLRNDILYKDNIISALKEKESNLYLQIQILSKESEQKFESLKQELDKSKEESINQILQEKGKEISELSNNITKLEKTIEEQKSEIKNLINKLNHDVTTKDQLLQNIFNKVTSFTTSFHIENSITCEFGNTSVNIYEHILLTLDKIANHIEILNSEKTKNESNIEKILSEARLEIRKLTQHNLNLMNDYSEVERKNQGLLSHLNIFKNDKDNLKNNLLDTQEIVQQLQNEVKLKAKEIESTEIKALEWKDKFVTLDNTMKQRLKELEEKNLELQMQYSELKNTKSIENYSFIIPDIGGDECYPQKPLRGPLSCSVITPEQKSPQSLLTLCCNKIIDYIQPDENEYKSITTSCSSANIEFNDEETQTNLCQCNNLTLVVENILQENSSLKNTAIELESENQLLLKEQEEVRKELKLMVEQANDLHRRILNHRTNLSTLSATTHAENKLLKSQVTVLQHRHNRFHSLCQRDIPAFKEQLVQLMTMLKGDSANALPIDTELQNVNFNRYMLPDVVDENSTISNFKNDSTLDGDLLMLDTNDTLSTSNDNTLMGHEQSSLNITLVYLDNGVTPCQANNLSEITDSNTLSQIEKLKNDNYAMFENLKKLIEQNNLLKVQLVKYLSEESSIHKKDLVSPVKYVDNKHDSSHHLTSEITATCSICEHNSDSVLPQQKLQEELKLVHEELTITKSQKEDIERKFNNLSLEIPATDALINKLNVLKKEYDIQSKEINKLNGTLNNKCIELKQLQEENDILSTQMMESISESDDLRKELDNLKAANEKLTEKCVLLETTVKEHENTINSKITCPQCLGKNYLTCSVEGKHSTQFHPKLNRSHSDSDRSSRCNKLCTLQNELHESKEDCKKITEEVATIKNQLENNMSMSQRMDLDDSLTDSAIFTFTKDLVNADSSLNKFNIPDITEERSFDVYSLDKADCFNYYVEKTCNVKGNLNQDFKIIDIMKMLYNHLTTEHKKEVEDLVNKLKDFEESKNKLQIQLDNITANYRKTVQEFNENDNNLKHTTNVFSQIRNNINTINEEIFNFTGTNKHNKIVLMFKENLLRLLDAEFSLSSVSLFECLIDSVINKHQEDLNDVTNKYTQLQRDMENVVSDLNIVNENLVLIKNQLSDKENDYNLLKAQKERLHEISNAVTLDIIKKEKELNETIATGCRQLLEHNIMKPEDIDLTLPLNKNINLIFERLTYLNTKNIEKENLALAVKNSKTIIEEKDKEIESLKVQKEKMQEINKNMRLELVSKENQLLEQKASLEDLNKNYRLKIEENSTKLKEETKITELMEKLKQEVSDLKSTNQIVMKEKDIIASELQKSGEIIKQNNKELDKMTSDILILRESVKENMSVIENLKEEAKLLLQENIELKEQLEQKCRDCSRLELNIKTHEKTAEVQSGIIMRLKKQKDEDSEASIEKDRQLVELTKKYVTLQRECETMKESITQSKEEFNILKNCNKKLETKVNELQVELENIDSGDKPHKSIERITEHTRRRRQTIHDSKRTFVGDNLHDQDKIDEVFAARSSSDDLFMEVDCDSSNRSTPIRLSKDRDSVPNKQDQTDKDEEHSPRPSSVVATRRRRQSIHDLHRNALQHTPSPHGKSSEISGNANDCITSESQLKERIASCVQELEELKERYRELDEECETCAEYLRERDEQCQRLKNEKTVLENRVTELQDKLKCVDQNKHGIAHASVNTDEDWTNLHSVVVDRMSYDAEVEKNKKLTKALEEFRYKNRELKATLAKMQDKFENITSNNEESQLKTRLSTCMRQLEEIQQKYKELDEECEVCAQYLREKEELCARLKKENNTLMEQMIDMKKKIHYMSPNKSQYNELKFAHACVNTDEDWANLHAVVVDRMSFDAEVEKNKKLTKAIEEFHLKNRQLKATVAKMQKALEKNTAKHNENDITELQSTNAELELCKKELEELKEKYKELDEECETCAEYLRERDEQCRKLKEAKIALETKLQELQEESNRVCAATAARKKRRSLHDQSREPLELSELSEQSAPRARAHAATDTGDDFLSYQVERDNARRVTDETHMKEMYRLKKMVEKLTEQKTALEHQLLAFSRAPAPQPVYVATGSAIVQNQQLTDIMKENQKLKRINAKLVSICKKRGKPLAENRENDDPAEQG